MSIYEYQFYEYAQKKNVGFVKLDVHDFCLSCLLSVYPVSSESPSESAAGMIIGIMENTVVNVVIRIGRILDLPARISASWSGILFLYSFVVSTYMIPSLTTSSDDATVLDANHCMPFSLIKFCSPLAFRNAIKIISRYYTLISRFPAIFIHTADWSSVICWINISDVLNIRVMDQQRLMVLRNGIA